MENWNDVLLWIGCFLGIGLMFFGVYYALRNKPLGTQGSQLVGAVIALGILIVLAFIKRFGDRLTITFG
jgi:hypothetical protein